MNDPKQTEFEVLKAAQAEGRMDNDELDPPDIAQVTCYDDSEQDS